MILRPCYSVSPFVRVSLFLLLVRPCYSVSPFVPVVLDPLRLCGPPLILWRSASSRIVILPSSVLVSYRLGSALSEWFPCVIVAFLGLLFMGLSNVYF